MSHVKRIKNEVALVYMTLTKQLVCTILVKGEDDLNIGLALPGIGYTLFMN